ncbi:maltase 2-like [Planococcus citri]|uniref:maltase 2-like n=1 Tax=Planococcus citri TaxID=170843 RepID=UPI0031F8261D
MECRRVIVAFWVLFSPLVIAFGVTEESPLEWWQTGVIYQIFPRSFKDSNGDGIGDLKGIEEKAEYLKDLGISAVWLSPIFESPMVDFGYDVKDYYKIASVFGTLDDFKSLKQKLDALGMKLLLDFVPNHTSDQSDWFQKSIKRIDPYTDFYIWKDPAGWNGSVPIPPNNWVSLFHGPAWKYNDNRKQFYLHQFAEQQPDLNFRCDDLIEEMERIFIFWLDQGADGFRMDSVAYMLEHPEFPSEPINENFSSNVQAHDSLIHTFSKDWPENYVLTKYFQDIVERYSEKDGKQRVIIHEAYTTFADTMKFYGETQGRHMPFNFLLITDIDDHSSAKEFSDVILKWLNGMPKNGWPNWVIGNHDNSRVANRFCQELVDGMNMINLLLPGTAITYNGEEIGMSDGKVRWDQTLDPQALNAGLKHFRQYTRDPERTPFQWDSSPNAGFTTNSKPWLPVNPNYWRLNLMDQQKSIRSHYSVFKQLVKLRSHPTFQRGDFKIFIISEWLLAFTRELQDSSSYAVLINLGSEQEQVILQNHIKHLPSSLSVHIASVNSEYETGDMLPTTHTGFNMRPKSALVLTTDTVEKAHQKSGGASWLGSVATTYTEYAFLMIHKLIAFTVV